MQTSRELVLRAIENRYPERIPICLSYDTAPCHQKITHSLPRETDGDIITIHSYDPEFIPPKEGYTQWGYKMETFGETMGEVMEAPLEDWNNFESWKAALPDFSSPSRFAEAKYMRKKYPDKFLTGGLGMMMMEILNLRGYANSMMDYYEEEDNLNKLIDCLYDCAKKMVDGYADAGLDAVIAWEDWGLQTRPMISYDLWHEYYYERMKDFVSYVHSKGLKYMLHSCGHIIYLMDTFVEIGVDVIQLDQQMNMGLKELSPWKNKICFWCPVDIQHSVDMTPEEMKTYISEMVETLSTKKGGFMYKVYAQPASIHMTENQLRLEIQLMQNQPLSETE